MAVLHTDSSYGSNTIDCTVLLGLAVHTTDQVELYPSNHIPSLGLVQASSTSGPTQLGRKVTSRPMRVCNSEATGLREYFSCTLPSGRPKWLIRTTHFAPISKACLIVGRAAIILCVYKHEHMNQCNRKPAGETHRWALLTVFPSRGTLKSTLTWDNIITY